MWDEGVGQVGAAGEFGVEGWGGGLECYCGLVDGSGGGARQLERLGAVDSYGWGGVGCGRVAEWERDGGIFDAGAEEFLEEGGNVAVRMKSG